MNSVLQSLAHSEKFKFILSMYLEEMNQDQKQKAILFLAFNDIMEYIWNKVNNHSDIEEKINSFLTLFRKSSAQVK